MINVKNVKKSYGAMNEILKGISFTIDEGDFVVILGASGSGKSTLLHVVSGIEIPDSGEIYYDESNIALFSDRDRSFSNSFYFTIESYSPKDTLEDFFG